jgi:hypothetical protein
MIGHEIGVIFKKHFWTGSNNANKRDLKGTVYDTLEHDDGSIPPEVKILVQEPEKRNSRKVKFSETEILILRDPTVDGSKEIHRNCLREAIIDTYSGARDDLLFTLQQLLDTAIKQNLCSSTLAVHVQVGPLQDDNDDDDDDNAELEETGDDNHEDKAMEEAQPEPAAPPQKPPDPTVSDGVPVTKAPEPKFKQGKAWKRTAAAAAAAQKDQPPAKKTRKPRTTVRTAHFAATAIRRIVTETQNCFGVETNATRFDKIKKAKKEFRLRDDTEGAAFAVLYATIQVCAMVTALGYDSEFLPLEPKNQRDARKRPDAHS